MIGRKNNYQYSPEKQKRFDEHQAMRRQQLKDLGHDVNDPRFRNPGWALINMVDEVKWNQKDNELYGSNNSKTQTSRPNYPINTGGTTSQGYQKDALTISQRPNVGTSNRKKLKQSGSSGALRISANTLNT